VGELEEPKDCEREREEEEERKEAWWEGGREDGRE